MDDTMQEEFEAGGMRRTYGAMFRDEVKSKSLYLFLANVNFKLQCLKDGTPFSIIDEKSENHPENCQSDVVSQSWMKMFEELTENTLEFLDKIQDTR